MMNIDHIRVYDKNMAMGTEISGAEIKELSLALEKDDFVIITFEKGYIDSYDNSCGYIKELAIIEMKEQQSN